MEALLSPEPPSPNFAPWQASEFVVRGQRPGHRARNRGDNDAESIPAVACDGGGAACAVRLAWRLQLRSRLEARDEPDQERRGDGEEAAQQSREDEEDPR